MASIKKNNLPMNYNRVDIDIFAKYDADKIHQQKLRKALKQAKKDLPVKLITTSSIAKKDSFVEEKNLTERKRTLPMKMQPPSKKPMMVEQAVKEIDILADANEIRNKKTKESSMQSKKDIQVEPQTSTSAMTWKKDSAEEEKSSMEQKKTVSVPNNLNIQPTSKKPKNVKQSDREIDILADANETSNKKTIESSKQPKKDRRVEAPKSTSAMAGKDSSVQEKGSMELKKILSVSNNVNIQPPSEKPKMEKQEIKEIGIFADANENRKKEKKTSSKQSKKDIRVEAPIYTLSMPNNENIEPPSKKQEEIGIFADANENRKKEKKTSSKQSKKDIRVEAPRSTSAMAGKKESFVEEKRSVEQKKTLSMPNNENIQPPSKKPKRVKQEVKVSIPLTWADTNEILKIFEPTIAKNELLSPIKPYEPSAQTYSVLLGNLTPNSYWQVVCGDMSDSEDEAPLKVCRRRHKKSDRIVETDEECVKFHSSEFYDLQSISTNTPSPNSTNTPSPNTTNTPSPNSTNTPSPNSTNTPPPNSTNTASPNSTNTASLNSTNTPPPNSTNTPPPNSANTASPNSTNTPSPNSTNTPSPNSTNTPSLNSTNTPSPNSTNTPSPNSTNTPSLNSTNTPSPNSTNTPSPNSTNTPSLNSTNTASTNSTNTPTFLDMLACLMNSSLPNSTKFAPKNEVLYNPKTPERIPRFTESTGNYDSFYSVWSEPQTPPEIKKYKKPKYMFEF